ncbi:MAG TPA: UDP-N-acetylmuramate:L-alanyl-gamma-D-glutamyl-meso-diaminopimelate ligase [Acidobacteriota bacterium]|nr:UDP-N-acetylmuramate:L-alanyl-gamma-D-glutamyl-meso-diaminopimelate ligase [Acidobacteriota bacterium]
MRTRSLFNGRINLIHMAGICGTGMASLAAMLKDSGYDVVGSDENVYPPMSDFLAAKNIKVRQGYTSGNPGPEADLAIIGNALSRGNPEVEHLLNARIPIMSMPEAIKHFFLRNNIPIVVTGTHGKTTTTSMIAWGLHAAGLKPNFLAGGIAENFQSSYNLEGGDYFVVEGDEYDSAFFDKGPKFLHYLPFMAVIGAIEFDHADIYPNLDAIKLQFLRFVNLIPQRGFIAVGADSPDAADICRNAMCDKETFGVNSENDWSPRNIELHDGWYGFDVIYRRTLYQRIRLHTFGSYNIRNALAATAILHHCGVSGENVRQAMESFQGVRRRLQFRSRIDGISIYEDFAHHPTAVRETLQSVRNGLNPERIWAIYEPRSATSRRNIFQKEIAEALSHADCVAVPELFRPEKVPENQRLDVNGLVSELRKRGRAAWNLKTAAGIIQKICEEARSGDLILIMSNGGFDGIYEKLPMALKNRKEKLELNDEKTE